MGMVYLYGQTQTERETINGIIQGTNSTRLQVSNLGFTPKHITVLLHTDSTLDPGTFIWALYDNGNITSYSGGIRDYSLTVDSQSITIQITNDGFILQNTRMDFPTTQQYYYEVY